MTHSASSKLGRNDPCPCGSGKKYKVCCALTAATVSPRQVPDIQTLHQQAQQAVARSDFAVAEYCYRKLHTAKPADAYILASLGQALCWLKRRREGVGYLLRAARLLERQAAKTREPRFAVELSGQLMYWGEIHAAERLARLAVSLTPDSPVVLNNLVLCLTRVNRSSEALPLSRRVCQMLPDHPGCNILLAIIESQSRNTDEALQRLTRVIERNDDPEQTARANLEMGVILDKLGRYEDAFAALTKAAEGHSALLDQHPSNRDYLFNVLQRNTHGFDADLLRRWPVNALINDGLPVPAFLMGFFRSGTTLTEQVLDAHPHLIATDESSIVHELTLELQRISGITNDHATALKSLEEAQLSQLRQFYWKRMREEYGDQVMHKQVVDKNTLNTIDLGVISVVFPEARILFALRDPRDICISCFMQAFTPTPATINLLSWGGIAKQYSAVMGYWLTLRDSIQPNYLELRYEDTVADFETAYRRVFECLGVEWRPEVARFHERAKGRYISTPSFAAVSQPVYRTAVARWKHYEKQFAAILPHLEPFIEAFGYAESSDPG
jgi:tetratricopeptide (TPR) repeat protein